jgi:HEAT repeat protein
MNFVVVCANCQSKVTGTETDEGPQFFCPVCNAFIHGLDFSQYLKDLATGDYITRHIVAEKFAYLDPSCAHLVVEPLTKALQDPSYLVRSSAAYSLCRLQPDEKGPMRMLVEYAAAPEPEIRQVCSRLLGDLKTHDPTAVRVLMDNLANDPEPEVRKQSAFSLGQMVPASAPAIPVLTKALKDSNSEVQMEAAISLTYFGPLAKAAIFGLQECINAQINNPFHDLRRQAVHALGDIGPDSFAFLLKLLKDHDDDVRYEAAHGLSKMGSNVLPGLEKLVQGLQDEHAGIVRECMQCLANVGTPAAKAAAEIEKAMKRFPDNASAQEVGNEALTKIAGAHRYKKRRRSYPAHQVQASLTRRK